ncbi:MAG: DUF445 domain-containing protein [Balneolaceae bacterium]
MPHTTSSSEKPVQAIGLQNGHTSHSGRPVEPPLHILRWLLPLPWLLLAGFLISFFWDFSGIETTFFGYAIFFEGLLRIVSVSGLIGFVTNRIAITMLFRPSQKRPIFGHGLIPANKDRIARRLAKTISDDLVNPDTLLLFLNESQGMKQFSRSVVTRAQDRIDDPDIRQSMKEWLLESLRSITEDAETKARIVNGLKSEIEQAVQRSAVDRAALKVYMLVKGRSLESALASIVESIPAHAASQDEALSALIDALPGQLESNRDRLDTLAAALLRSFVQTLDIEQLIISRLNRYDESKLEAMIKGATHEHLKAIQYFGALFGLIGGFVIWNPVLSLLGIALLTAVLTALDLAMQRAATPFSPNP